ncbi:class I SAM-dependent methyltransferase [uncultured Phycicoccus sp.]|uniref:class I SAM-dependent methyltransferase n=1 Tax=uncultured Phycicoccus sp. TaxID=661422 RepID=UPI002604771F|nr:class I SAM-dependent methyltransferase [uncultured Phycicoccus sp.]
MTTTTTTRTTTAVTGPAAGPPVSDTAAADRLVQVLEDGSVAVLLGIGYDTGLFETLVTLPPATSRQIADAAGLDERYVREWLGGVVCGGLVGYDPTAGTYALREEVGPLVTGPGPDNLARTMRIVSLMGAVAPRITACFRTGGGLRYEDYPGFHDVQAEDSGAVHDVALLDAIVPLTGLTERLRAGIDVLDIGCGEGHAVNLLGRAYPASRLTGYDLSAEALQAARAEASAWGLTNVTFAEHDVATLPEGRWDLVTAFDTVHDQAHPATVLGAVRRALRADGTFLMVDINASSRLEDNADLPWGAFLYAVSTLHCMSVSLGQGGDGLGTVWGVQLAERMIREAGFERVTVHELEQDPFNVYVVARP